LAVITLKYIPLSDAIEMTIEVEEYLKRKLKKNFQEG